VADVAVFRVRRRLRGPLTRPKAVFIALVISLALMMQSLFLLERRIEPTLMILATQKAEQLAKEAIADAVTKRIVQQGIDIKELANILQDRDGQIQAINWNAQENARIVGETTQRIQNRLEEFESQKIDQSIPLGLVTGNSFLAQMGPDLPLKFVPVGSVRAQLRHSLSEAGINMVLMTIYMYVEVDLRIVIPFATEKKTVTSEIPIAHSLIIGKVPYYLYNNPEGKPEVPKLGVGPEGQPILPGGK
jgi:sporulation protein YunB